MSHLSFNVFIDDDVAVDSKLKTMKQNSNRLEIGSLKNKRTPRGMILRKKKWSESERRKYDKFDADEIEMHADTRVRISVIYVCLMSEAVRLVHVLAVNRNENHGLKNVVQCHRGICVRRIVSELFSLSKKNDDAAFDFSKWKCLNWWTHLISIATKRFIIRLFCFEYVNWTIGFIVHSQLDNQFSSISHETFVDCQIYDSGKNEMQEFKIIFEMDKNKGNENLLFCIGLSSIDRISHLTIYNLHSSRFKNGEDAKCGIEWNEAVAERKPTRQEKRNKRRQRSSECVKEYRVIRHRGNIVQLDAKTSQESSSKRTRNKQRQKKKMKKIKRANERKEKNERKNENNEMRQMAIAIQIKNNTK